jgi:ectoine hydroxylase-related dioxygenase (phytanoyl-CoA dioxygenase family)
VVSGSQRLTTPTGPRADNVPARSGEVKAYLRTLHPWLLELWNPDGGTDRISRYLDTGAVIDGVDVRVEELTGEPGDAVIMHPRLLHTMAANSLDTPRMMLLQFLHLRS